MELLVVLAIIATLAAISVPAVGGMMRSYSLSSTAQAILGQLSFGRQDALANNRAVQVRIYQIKNNAGNLVYRAIQTFRETTNSQGTDVIVPITKAYIFPTGISIVYSATVTAPSTLFTTATSGAVISAKDTNNPLPPPYGASPYLCFRFRPNGQTDLLAPSTLTIAPESAKIVANNLPANFITLQIDDVNGVVRTYQP